MKPFLVAAVTIVLTVALVLFLDRQYPGVLSNDDNQIDLIWKLAVLGALTGSLMVGLRRERLGAIARSLLVWVILGLALVAGYSFKDELAPVWRRMAGSLSPAEPVSVSPGVVTLRASTGGQFRAAADVAQGGGAWQRVVFLVDTGASDVALSRDDAKRLGIDVGRLTYNIPYRTANGTGMGARVRLDRVRLGDITVEGVAGSVVQGDLDQSLLGMSFLRRLSGFEIRGDEMVLRE